MRQLYFGRLSNLVYVVAILPSAGTLATRGERGRAPVRMRVSTGQYITPVAAPGARIDPLYTDLRRDDNANAANGVTSALSADGSTLLILTSGYNNSFFKEDGTPIVYPTLDPTTGLATGGTSSAEWVFVYDVTGPVPVQKQKINLPVTYNGLVWNPAGTRFYVSGGADDIVYPFKKVKSGGFQLDAPFIALNTGGQLDHTKAGPTMKQFGLAPFPVVAGLGVSKDGRLLYAANFENDSVSVVDTQSTGVKESVFSTVKSELADRFDTYGDAKMELREFPTAPTPIVSFRGRGTNDQERSPQRRSPSSFVPVAWPRRAGYGLLPIRPVHSTLLN